DFLHDGIPFRIVGQGALGAKESLPWVPTYLVGNHLHLDLNLLALGHAQVFVQFNGFSVYSTVKGFGHRLSSKLVEESAVLSGSKRAFSCERPNLTSGLLSCQLAHGLCVAHVPNSGLSLARTSARIAAGATPAYSAFRT